MPSKEAECALLIIYHAILPPSSSITYDPFLAFHSFMSPDYMDFAYKSFPDTNNVSSSRLTTLKASRQS